MPGIGSDIADPDVKESAYEGTPIEPLLSLLVDGIEPLSREYPRDARAAAVDDLAAGPRRRTGQQRLPRRAVRRPGRADHARAQLSRRDAGLRQGPDLRRDDRVREQGQSRGDDRRHRQHSEPVERGVRDRAAVDPRLRSDDRPRRDRRGLAGRPSSRGQGRRHPRGRQLDGRVGGHRRRDRRTALSRRHRLELVRGRPRTDPADLEGWPRHPGRDPLRRARRDVGLQAPRDRACSRAQRCGAGVRARPGDRPMGQLVQPGAVRQANRSCRGRCGSTTTRSPPASRPAPPSTRRSCTSRCGTSRCASRCCESIVSSGFARAACSRCTSSATRSAGSGSRACASIPRTPPVGCASTSG